jgi:hypothetical protein
MEGKGKVNAKGYHMGDQVREQKTANEREWTLILGYYEHIVGGIDIISSKTHFPNPHVSDSRLFAFIRG